MKPLASKALEHLEALVLSGLGLEVIVVALHVLAGPRAGKYKWLSHVLRLPDRGLCHIDLDQGLTLGALPVAFRVSGHKASRHRRQLRVHAL